MNDLRWWLSSERVVLGAASQAHIAPAVIELTGGTISALYPLDGFCLPVAAAAERHVHYGDKLIAPAFINAHTHLALGFLRGAPLQQATLGNMVESYFFDIEQRMSKEDVYAFSLMGAYDSLLAGVGLVYDHYYAAEQVAQAIAEAGLMGVVAPTLQDVAGPGKHAWQQQLCVTETLAGNSWRARGIYAAVGPHASDTVSASLFEHAVTLAERQQLPLHMHLAQSLEEYRRAMQRHGCSPTQWLSQIGVLTRAPRALMAHGIYTTHSDISLLARHRHALVFCPYSQLVFGFPAAVDQWQRLGANWLVATDCASSNDTMNVQQELRLVAGQRSLGASWSQGYRDFMGSGSVAAAERAWRARNQLHHAATDMVTPAALLSRVWSLPGKLHPHFVAGVIQVGAVANLAVFDMSHPALWPAHDPLAAVALADAAQALWAMWVNGVRIGRDGALRESIVGSDGYRSARQQADARRRALLSRDGG